MVSSGAFEIGHKGATASCWPLSGLAGNARAAEWVSERCSTAETNECLCGTEFILFLKCDVAPTRDVTPF